MSNSLFKKVSLQISRGEFETAKNLIHPLAKKNPPNFEACFLMGSSLLGLRLFQEALVWFLKAFSINDKNIHLLNNMGSAYGSLKDYENASIFYTGAIQLDPKFREAHYNLGNALMSQEKWLDAISSYSNAIEIKNNYAEAYCNMSICLSHLNAYSDAINVCDTYLNQFGYNPRIVVSKSRALHGKGMKANAIQTLEESILLEPNSYEMHTVLADFCMEAKQYEKAISHYIASIKINPLEYANYNNLGVLYWETGNISEAIDIYTKSISINPLSPVSYQNIANIYNQQKDYESSLRYLEKAFSLDKSAPYILGMIAHAKIYTCNWTDLDFYIDQIHDHITSHGKISNPFPPIAYIDDQKLLSKIAFDWVHHKYPKSNFLPPAKAALSNEKIKIAYFSADFHSHATALLMAGMLEYHDKNKFELFAFSFGPDSNDHITNRIRKSFDHFIDIKKLSDRAVAAYARELKIDIAIDLKGFTQDARTGIFAERAAAVQINYLGFPGSMGAPYIDFIVADTYLIPEGHEKAYTEQIARLPNCYQPNDHLREISKSPQTRADHLLPENALVLCSFNNNYKITPLVFDIWMRLLKQFPHAVLWLLKDTPTAENNLRMEARARGVDSDRLIFAPRLKPEAHLARHVCADLFLDTYPCNAHTTASDALWTGLPMVTCSGNSFASRVAGSLLTTIGLPDLITHNLTDYESKLVELISNPSLLAEVKNRLQENKQTSPLFDTQQYTKDWEHLLLQLHQQSVKA
jgi:predicted O-linked N-acetylglucosamine transferase (SPINDLY family)